MGNDGIKWSPQAERQFPRLRLKSLRQLDNIRRKGDIFLVLRCQLKFQRDPVQILLTKMYFHPLSCLINQLEL